MTNQLPLYQCHKQVRALQIDEISEIGDHPNKTYQLGFVNKSFSNKIFDGDHKLFSRYTPEVGDYYVVYDDGYESFSPRKAFEDGYTLIESA